MKDVITVVLAGGKGSRLEPLTRDRAKPAVPFGGSYRIIDFAMSNCVNSGLKKVLLLTQYKAMSLDRHINLAWQPLFCRELGEFVDILPPQQRIDENWYQGTADAVYQNIYAIEKARPEHVVVLAGDHIYKMNYGQMVEQHIASGADLTIGALPVDRESAKQFGVMQVDSGNKILGFEEKPSEPRTIPGSSMCLASMGIYVFSARFLFEQLCRDANLEQSRHDFGRDIIPSVIHTHRVHAFAFADENRKTQAYWRDVGTLDSYYQANMDLVTVDPLLNMYDQAWPVRTYQPNLPPAKFVFGSSQHVPAAPGATSAESLSTANTTEHRIGHAVDSVVCHGTVISGGFVERCVVGCSVRINSFSHVSDSILFDQVEIGRHARIRRAILDKGVCIPPGTQIGFDSELDRQRGLTVTSSGLVVVAKGDQILGDLAESKRMDQSSNTRIKPTRVPTGRQSTQRQF